MIHVEHKNSGQGLSGSATASPATVVRLAPEVRLYGVLSASTDANLKGLLALRRGALCRHYFEPEGDTVRLPGSVPSEWFF